MKNSFSMTREVLGNLQKLQGSTIFVGPSGIGSIQADELGLLLQDAALLVQLGVQVVLFDFSTGSFWGNPYLLGELSHIYAQNDTHLAELAKCSGAVKLCLIAGSDHLTAAEGRQLDDISLEQAQQLLKERSIITREGRGALERAVLVCQAGVSRTHIFNVRSGALLDELLTDRGAGTMIYTNTPHKCVRRMSHKDQHQVCALLQEKVPRKTATFVRDHKEEMRVFVIDDNTHAISRVVCKHNILIVLSLIHSPRVAAAEALEFLLRAAMDEAFSLGLSSVVVPIDEIPALMRILPWFTSLGFRKTHVDFGGNARETWIRTIQ